MSTIYLKKKINILAMLPWDIEITENVIPEPNIVNIRVVITNMHHINHETL